MSLAAGCGSSEDEPDDRVDVVAALFPLAEVVRAVGGTSVGVTDLTPPGVEPHDVELRPSDVERIQDADLVVVIGGGFQPAVERAANRRDGPTLRGAASRRSRPARVAGPDGDEPRRRKIATALSNVSGSDEPGYRQRVNGLRRGDVRAGSGVPGGSCNVPRPHARDRARRCSAISPGDTTWSKRGSPASTRARNRRPPASRRSSIWSRPRASRPCSRRRLYRRTWPTRWRREADVKTAVLDPLEGVSDAEAQRGVGYDASMRRNLATLRAAARLHLVSPPAEEPHRGGRKPQVAGREPGASKEAVTGSERGRRKARTRDRSGDYRRRRGAGVAGLGEGPCRQQRRGRQRDVTRSRSRACRGRGRPRPRRRAARRRHRVSRYRWRRPSSTPVPAVVGAERARRPARRGRSTRSRPTSGVGAARSTAARRLIAVRHR